LAVAAVCAAACGAIAEAAIVAHAIVEKWEMRIIICLYFA